MFFCVEVVEECCVVVFVCCEVDCGEGVVCICCVFDGIVIFGVCEVGSVLV